MLGVYLSVLLLLYAMISLSNNCEGLHLFVQIINVLRIRSIIVIIPMLQITKINCVYSINNVIKTSIVAHFEIIYFFILEELNIIVCIAIHPEQVIPSLFHCCIQKQPHFRGNCDCITNYEDKHYFSDVANEPFYWIMPILKHFFFLCAIQTDHMNMREFKL